MATVPAMAQGMRPKEAANDGPTTSGAALEAVTAFYDDPDWLGRMRYFDASYRGNETEMFRRLAVGIRETLQDSGLTPLLLAPSAAMPRATGAVAAAAELPRRGGAAAAEPEVKPEAARRVSGQRPSPRSG
ncbi:hypothetical protein AAFN88_20135 [Pelagibius sp. CAU 1746]|uniref:hypothetical protein n=1 Tax=Pelagibius sp. CAU 1746 TaxID=3140370 RepID=UPI00325B93CC